MHELRNNPTYKSWTEDQKTKMFKTFNSINRLEGNTSKLFLRTTMAMLSPEKKEEFQEIWRMTTRQANVAAVNAVPEIYPERSRLQAPIKGCGTRGVSVMNSRASDVITMIDTIRYDGPRFNTIDLSESVVSDVEITSAYSVVTNQLPDRGRLETMIVENSEEIGFGNWVYVFEVDSLGEAEGLVAHLNDPTVTTFIDEMVRARRSSTKNLTKEMITRLPTFKEA